MAGDPKAQALEALFLTLADNLPAELAARDALRAAKRRCRKGPYTHPAGTVTINGESFALGAGVAASAATVAAGFAGAVSFAATAEADGAGSRLVFTGASAPAFEAPSCLAFDGDPLVWAGLGLRPVASDVAEVAIASPEPHLFAGEPGSMELIDRPWIFPEGAIAGTYSKGGTRSRIRQVRIRLAVWVPGDGALPLASTLAKVHEIERALAACVRTGDGRAPLMVGGVSAGAHVIQCKPSVLSALPKAYAFRSGSATIPVGMGSPDFDLLVQSTDT